MTTPNLDRARREVATCETAIAILDAEVADDEQARAIIDARLTTHKAARETMIARKVARDRELAAAEQQTLDQYCVELAAETIKLQGDPLRNRDRVIANLQLLRRAVRTPLDWPINRPYFLEPIVTQALALLPPRSEFDTPVNELRAFGGTPWAERVRQLLTEFETDAPLAAA